MRRQFPRVCLSGSVKTLILSALILCSFPFLAGADSATSTSTARVALQKRYDQWSAAYLKNDAAVLLRILSPDFSLKTGGGRVLARAQYEAILRKRKPDASGTRTYETRIKRLVLSKDAHVATAFTTETITEKTLSVPGSKRPPTRITHLHDYRDRWIWHGGQWLLLSSETLDESSHS